MTTQGGLRKPIGERCEAQVARQGAETGLQFINPYSSEDGRYPINVELIRSYDRDTLIRRLAYAIKHEDWRPTVEEIEALICLNVKDYYKTFFSGFGDNMSVGQVDEVLPWPSKAIQHEGQSLDDELEDVWIPVDRVFDVKVVQTELGDLDDNRNEENGGSDAILKLLDLVVTKLDSAERAQLAGYITRNFSTFYDFMGTDDIEAYAMFDMAFKDIDPNSEEGLLVGRSVLVAIEAKAREVEMNGDPQSDMTWYLGEYWWHLNRNDRDVMLLRAIAQVKQEHGEVTDAIGILLRRHESFGINADDLPGLLNRIREIINLTSDERERGGLANLLREILAITTNSEAHTTLEHLYNSIRFEDYQISRETRKFRVDLLERQFDQLGIGQDDLVIDVACGTGWLVRDLVARGYSRCFGIDENLRHLDVANQDRSGRFVQGDWNRLPYSDGSVDCAMCMGRSLPHVENSRGLSLALREMNRVLKGGATGIIDMPDPAQGEYYKRLQAYREYLRRYGLKGEDLEGFWFEVSSPDGENFYNRYIPPREEIVKALKLAGFEVINLTEEDIPGSNGDKNLVFTFRKIASRETGYFRRYSNKPEDMFDPENTY